jgi:hypothetical protein
MSDQSPPIPNAWQLERAVSAWQQLRAFYANDPALADDEEVITAALADAEITHPEVLLTRAIDALLWAEQREVEADDLRRQDIARRDRYRSRIEALRTLIEQLLTALELKRHTATRGRAVLALTRPAIVITDEALVPGKFIKIERSFDKLAMRAALDAGEDVPGAVLSNPAPALQIRKL